MTFEEIKELIALFDDSSIASLSIKNDDVSLKLDKSSTAAPIVAAPVVTQVPAPAAPAVIEPASTPAPVASVEGDVITSPMVGTFYQAPSPDSAPYAKVGDTVKKGQTIAIIEAMKIMNELEAEYDCKILEILVDDASVIEYDMPLYRVERI